MERLANPPHDKDNFDETPSTSYTPLFLQQINKIKHIPHVASETPPSALRALLKLTNAPHSHEIGLHGPALAATASESNNHLAELGLYQEVYPRDAHVTASLLQTTYPELTRATVLACLPFTGVESTLTSTAWIDEQEIGKIPHQIRAADHPRSRYQFELRGRGYPYYGAIDTTQKNILAISHVALNEPPESLAFLSQTYRDIHGQAKSVADGLEANINWVLERMSLTPEGLIESLQINPRHHANQSWVDSPDSFHHADGSFARHYPEQGWGVASVEVNAETYDALLAATRLYETKLPTADDTEKQYLSTRIAELEAAAAKLKESILKHFWVEDEQRHGGFFGRGTDRDENGHLRPLKIRSSDMGHLLSSQVLDDDDPKIEAIIKNLFSDEMLATNGIRTLSTDSVRYHKNAYHNGCVWPWDTYKIALGLEKRGYYALAKELEERIINFYLHTNTLAEYGSGDNAERINMSEQVTIFDPDLSSEPIDQYSVYNVVQPPQEIQAWTVAAILAIKHKNSARFRDPAKHPTGAIDPQKKRLEDTILKRITRE